MNEAAILVGGQGLRLRSMVRGRPKPMALVSEKPFLEWLVLQARKQGIEEIIFCTGYLGEMVKDYFGTGERFGMQFFYSQEHKPLGTGGALRLASGQIHEATILVLNGDSYCRYDSTELYHMHQKRKAPVTMWLQSSDDCSRFGAVEIGKDDSILALTEKTGVRRSGLINSGVYVMERDFISAIPDGRFVSLEREMLPGIVGRGLSGVIGSGPFVDIGTPESYLDAEKLIREEKIS